MLRRRARSVLFAVMVAMATATVFAHMKASRMLPAPNTTVSASPAQVQVWFTQAPDPKVSKIEVAGMAGPVALTAFKVTAEKSIVADIRNPLADGRYTVRWQAAGDDGHVQKGEFAFTVKLSR
jgi:methionine-rich copper-binding protein CopC